MSIKTQTSLHTNTSCCIISKIYLSNDINFVAVTLLYISNISTNSQDQNTNTQSPTLHTKPKHKQPTHNINQISIKKNILPHLISL
jgi:hypothetical protein